MNMMYCKKCNNQVPDDSQFCPFCGNQFIRVKVEVEQPSAPVTHATEPMVMPTNTDPEAMLKRAFLFIEDGLFERADQYLELILDQDPENARAYLGKLMIDLRVNTQEQLAEQEQPFDRNGNYVKAVRYGDEKMANMLISYSEKVKQEAYEHAVQAMNDDADKQSLQAAAMLFNSLGNYKDAAVLKEQTVTKLKVLTTNESYEEIYTEACEYAEGNTVEGLEKAVELFESICFYEDAQDKADTLKALISQIREQEEEDKFSTIGWVVLGLILLVLIIAAVVSNS